MDMGDPNSTITTRLQAPAPKTLSSLSPGNEISKPRTYLMDDNLNRLLARSKSTKFSQVQALLSSVCALERRYNREFKYKEEMETVANYARSLDDGLYLAIVNRHISQDTPMHHRIREGTVTPAAGLPKNYH
ncbi:hypothetical protein IFM89_013297 [Coptis chinensis]|uniref:Uncharacterized protein n=1 Tax=Coptis chinensis TaxID=261450 RepID=A0A835HAH9_9MAGN|nr:hypothetical protein IFM89_013297 [Coptis chinensis]